jgi:hypothetical protein
VRKEYLPVNNCGQKKEGMAPSQTRYTRGRLPSRHSYGIKGIFLAAMFLIFIEAITPLPVRQHGHAMNFALADVTEFSHIAPSLS